MSVDFAFFIEGLDQLADIENIAPSIRLNAARAINTVTRDARSSLAFQIEHEVNFPPGYLSPGRKKLYVSGLANRNNLEGVITASGNPTSLARFVQGGAKAGRHGALTVRVGNQSKTLKRAFLMKLRQGSGAITEDRFNLGLAIRLKPGESLANKRFVRKISSGLYLLYGPSVDQVFLGRDGTGAVPEQSEQIADHLETEFLRLMDLKNVF